MAFERVLIAVDEQPVAEHAGTVGADLAARLHEEVALITVFDTSQSYAAGAGIVADNLQDRALGEAKRLLAGLRQRLSLPASTLAFVEQGAPAVEIVKAASDWPADAIVIGSYGRRPIERVFIGPVADEVLRTRT